MSEEPERARINTLLEQVTRGQVTEAETEELALYVAEDPSLRAEVATRAKHAELGEGWLARLEADHAIARVEESPRAKLERGAGLALFVVGLVATPLTAAAAPALGPTLLVLGLAILIWSYARVRLATYSHDPYKDVQR